MAPWQGVPEEMNTPAVTHLYMYMYIYIYTYMLYRVDEKKVAAADGKGVGDAAAVGLPLLTSIAEKFSFKRVFNDINSTYGDRRAIYRRHGRLSVFIRNSKTPLLPRAE